MLVQSLPPHGRPFEGMTLRLFDPNERVWRIWWTSSRYPGRLDPPVVGRFTDGVGLFYADDELDGKPIKVRFEWTDTTTDCPKWNQAFSFDDGLTWKPTPRTRSCGGRSLRIQFGAEAPTRSRPSST
jgi:hypothetical protein